MQCKKIKIFKEKVTLWEDVDKSAIFHITYNAPTSMSSSLYSYITLTNNSLWNEI